ncbi:MAG: hypothetical protein ACFFG0_27205, partial [Candidatus Thorarchaeota archaeon]
TLASELAKSQAEEDYTRVVTRQSTLWSSLVLLPLIMVTAGTSSLISGATTMFNTVLKPWQISLLRGVFYAASIPIQVEVEVWEELYLDPWIESVMYKLGNYFGWSDSTSEFWGMFICSFREAFMGAAKFAIKGMVGGFGGSDISNQQEIETIIDTNTLVDTLVDYFSESTIDSLVSDFIGEQSVYDYALDTLDQITETLDQVEDQISILSSKKEEAKFKITVWSVAKRILSLGKLIPSFMVGAGGFALNTYLMDVTADYIFDVEKVEKALYNRKLSKKLTQLTGFKHILDLKSKFLQGLIIEQTAVSNFPKSADPLNPSSALTSSVALQGQFNAYDTDGTEYNVEILSHEEFMKQKQEIIKANLIKAEDLKVKLDPNFDGNFFEIFVAEAAEQADPVVEVNGMKIWIQPLPAEHYNLKHEMTLNDFLALIGILNDPSKQAIFNGYILQHGAEILIAQGIIRLDGNMPLSLALDLIGYDRNNLEDQFNRLAHRIQIIDTATILQLQDDTTALFHPDVREEIFFRHDITDYQRSYFSKKVLDAFSIVELRFQDTFRETIYESAYNLIKIKYSEDFGITQEEWLELVDFKAKDEDGIFTQEFEKIVDLCLKEQVFLNLIELSGAQDQDVDAIFSTLDTYLDENFGSLIEQLFNPLAFEAFISEVVNQFLNNMDNEGFVAFNVPTQEYFAELFNQPLPQIAFLAGGLLAPEMIKSAEIEIEANHKTELNNLALLIYKIIKFDSSQRGLTITDQLLNLHTSENSYQYTVKDLSDLLQKLGLTNDIFRNQKTFYATILDKIKYLNEHTEISLNPQIREKISRIANSITKSFDEDISNGYTNEEVDIFELLDPLLDDLFGYVGYSLLQLGLIRFDNDGNAKFELPSSLKDLKDHLKLFNIKSIAHTRLNYNKRDSITDTELIEIITSIILSGHFKSIAKVDENGRIIRNDPGYVYTHPMASFLSETFKNFRISERDPSYHWSIWNQISNVFFNYRLNHLSPTDISLEKSIFQSYVLKINDKIKTLGQVYTGIDRIDKANNLLYNIKKDFISQESRYIDLKIDLFTDLISDQEFLLKLGIKNPYDIMGILAACGIYKNPTKLTDYDVMQIARMSYGSMLEFGSEWKDAANIAFGFFKVKHKDGKTVDGGTLISNSKAMEMFGIASDGRSLNKEYPKYLMSREDLQRRIFDHLFVFLSAQWSGWHSETKILMTLLDLYYDKMNEISEIEIYISSEWAYCSFCYDNLMSFKEFLENQDITVKIFLRNEAAESNTYDSYEKDGAQNHPHLFFSDKYLREIDDPPIL